MTRRPCCKYPEVKENTGDDGKHHYAPPAKEVRLHGVETDLRMALLMRSISFECRAIAQEATVMNACKLLCKLLLSLGVQQAEA